MNEVQTPSSDKRCDNNQQDREVIEVLVNNAPVKLQQRRVTGLIVKQTAIDQGVRIKLDFVLFLHRGNGQRQVVGDADTITVHCGSQFDAIPHDDDS